MTNSAGSAERSPLARVLLNRRTFLAGLAAVSVAACSGSGDGGDAATTVTPTPEPPTSPSPEAPVDPTAAPESTAVPEPTTTPLPAVDLPGDPFTLGVASGDPTTDSLILWTRLAPIPLEGGGMPDTDVPVLWEVSADADFADVVTSGVESATSAFAHSLHIDVGGLSPETWYHYRFLVGEWVSPTGRGRTAPASGSTTPLSFAFSSCQFFEDGFYAAWRHAAADQPDLIVFLGDYIYEYPPGEFAGDHPDGADRVHRGGEALDVAGYRNRYALYKSDADLQAAHAACPWVITWDDHEVDNDYADDVSADNADLGVFLERRAAAYQAWYEHQPVRLPPPTGPDYPIHRTVQFGDLAAFHVLDGRQYRSDQPCADGNVSIAGLGSNLPLAPICEETNDPNRTMLGADQEAWLDAALDASTATWDVLAQQVFMFGATLPLQGDLVVTDTWDGYAAARTRLVESLQARQVANPIVLTGDFHSAAVGDVRADPFDRELPVVATELMAPAISSSFFVGEELNAVAAGALLLNPQIRYFDARNGYALCELTPDQLTAEIKLLDDTLDPASGITTGATFVVRNGTPGAERL